MTKSYRVGSLKDFKDWSVEVVRDPTAAEGVPKQWYDSEETARAGGQKRAKSAVMPAALDQRSADMVVRLISENLPVLTAIGRRSPASIRELAAMTGRSDSNLHRSLKKLEQVGLVAFKPGPHRRRRPVLTARKVKLEIDLAR